MTKEEAIEIIKSKRDKEKYSTHEWCQLNREALFNCGDYWTPEEKKHALIILTLTESLFGENND